MEIKLNINYKAIIAFKVVTNSDGIVDVPIGTEMTFVQRRNGYTLMIHGDMGYMADFSVEEARTLLDGGVEESNIIENTLPFYSRLAEVD